MVYIKISNSTGAKPAVIRNFVSVSIILQQPSQETDQLSQENTSSQSSQGTCQQKFTVHLACIDWLLEHEHKTFYGSPAEVWRKYCPSARSDIYVPVACIKCQCAYVDHIVQFNQILTEEVTVVIPINHFSGL